MSAIDTGLSGNFISPTHLALPRYGYFQGFFPLIEFKRGIKNRLEI